MRPWLAAAAALSLASAPCPAREFGDPATFAERLGIEEGGGALRYRRLADQPVVRILEDAEAARVREFVARLEAEPSRADELLRQTALPALAAAGIAPTAVTPDGTIWFRRFFGLGLTGDGERAIPAVLLGDPFGAPRAERGVDSEPGDRNLGVLAMPIAANPAIAAQPLAPPSDVAQPGRREPPAPAPTPSADDRLFLASQGLWHIGWLLDLLSTYRVLKAGGREMMPLYTLFGASNIMGVLLSAAVVYALSTWAVKALYRKAKEVSGPAGERYIRIIALITALAGVVHLAAAAHNFRQLK